MGFLSPSPQILSFCYHPGELCGNVILKGGEGTGMNSLWTELNWELIILLIVVSAVVAYVGDYVGMKIGKRRISLFGLRPRHTSSVITVLTGLLISVATLAVVSATSEPVRTSLIGMKYVQRQIVSLTAELQKNRSDLEAAQFKLFLSQQEIEEKQKALAEIEIKLKESIKNLRQAQTQLTQMRDHAKDLEAQRKNLEKELLSLKAERESLAESVAQLQETASRLKEGLQQIRGGRIIVFSGELLAQVVVPERTSVENAEKALRLLIERASELVAFRSGLSRENVIVIPSEASREEALKEISDAKERKVLRLTASANAVQGEPITADIHVFPSVLIFKQGEELAEKKISGPMTQDEAERFLFTLLHEVNIRAVNSGVLPDPLRGTVGNLTATEFYETLDQISKGTGEREVVVVALKDIFSEGPVRIKIEIKPLS